MAGCVYFFTELSQTRNSRQMDKNSKTPKGLKKGEQNYLTQTVHNT